MKKLLLLLTLFVCGCAVFSKVNLKKAEAVVQKLIKAENNGDYQSTSQYYTDDFNHAEPLQARNAKFKELHDTFGDMTGVELISAKDTTDPSDWPCARIIYRVKHTRLNSVETFIVIWDKGHYKVEAHNIVADNE